MLWAVGWMRDLQRPPFNLRLARSWASWHTLSSALDERPPKATVQPKPHHDSMGLKLECCSQEHLGGLVLSRSSWVFSCCRNSGGIWWVCGLPTLKADVWGMDPWLLVAARSDGCPVGSGEAELLLCCLSQWRRSTPCTRISLVLSLSFLGCNEHHKQVWSAALSLSCFFSPHQHCLKVSVCGPEAQGGPGLGRACLLLGASPGSLPASWKT